MRLFVGLGNPGAKYQGNRHNIGFMVIDEIARRHGFSPWRRRFQGETADGALDGERVTLLKPLTYMNESGRAVQEAANFFKLELGDITVFHDEIELPDAKLRVKIGGGIAGHNGLRSISAHVGNEYRRVRLGVGHPGVKELVHGHVLNDFAKSERPWVEALVEAVAVNAALVAAGRDSTFANKVHLAMQAKGFLDKGDKAEK
ncbi:MULTISPECIES: aminoacyl-tRNA hydrolase [Rhodopseudomonas]|uniref:Peptidyl-tRNA hydrolase n=1 Tax=Rhodopseudomonas palustris TaxID=1076 RepID=A0A0D7ET01_RHOPL|nr:MULTISPECIES: aminoacyl-tRNA hydrolase [Rhodopseudomonas]KIZ43680.1 peptidyl-tRNA hydrolase [Rhodopseudomonas palustris]MDF3808882.1 aminoacyl-tRNA hydrolase [Rhodopseudomonas sp. BAL398]WOK15556.1 aminoacyl-tRNA hydrolase [Rhodopseudomonas sp. BAL398]